MRKGHDGEWRKNGGEKNNGEYQPSGAGGNGSPLATPYRLVNQKWPTGSGKGSNPRLMGVLINFS